MLRRILTVILIIAGISGILSIYQNRPQFILSKIDLGHFPDSPTQFNYKIYLFGMLPVGKAMLEDKGVKLIENVYLRHLSAAAESAGMVSKVYPFKIAVDSYLEPNSLLPVLWKKKIKTKEKEKIKDIYYNQKNNTMRINKEDRNIFPQTYDPLSAVLKLRSVDLDKISNFDLNINTNQKNYSFAGTVNKAYIRTKSGDRLIFMLNAKIFRKDKNPYHQSKINLILLDGRKIPLFIKVFASGVLITARLVSVK